MGRRGPPPTPTRVLQLRGTYRPDRRSDAEPQPTPVGAVPKAPAYLGPVGRREWKRVAAELHTLQLLTVVDLAALEGYCAAYQRAVEAEKAVKVAGRLIRTPQGFLQPHPELAIAKQAWAEVRRFAGEFGMTPSARTRVRVPESPPAPAADPFGEFAHERPRERSRGDEASA